MKHDLQLSFEFQWVAACSEPVATEQEAVFSIAQMDVLRLTESPSNVISLFPAAGARAQREQQDLIGRILRSVRFHG